MLVEGLSFLMKTVGRSYPTDLVFFLAQQRPCAFLVVIIRNSVSLKKRICRGDCAKVPEMLPARATQDQDLFHGHDCNFYLF
jgi:hypothetical protein